MSDQLQTNLGYTFSRHALLKNAITHPSFTNEQGLEPVESNARLEFLGDSVLQIVISDYLYHRFPEYPEGDLTRIRAGLVCESSLVQIAKSIQLSNFLLLGQGEKENKRSKDSILADAMEAVLGAIFLDSGLEESRHVIIKLYTPYLEKLMKQNKDFKSTLQEYLQKETHETATYTIISETGPDHAKTFTAEVTHQGAKLGKGTGPSKKTAEQEAARMALIKLNFELM